MDGIMLGWVDPVGQLPCMILTIINLIKKVKNNKKLYKDISCRLKLLKGQLVTIPEDHTSDEVRKALKNLEKVLNSVQEKIEEFDNAMKVTRVLKSKSYKLKVDRLNQLLTNATERLTPARHAYEEESLTQQQCRLDEQEEWLTQQQHRLEEQQRMQQIMESQLKRKSSCVIQ